MTVLSMLTNSTTTSPVYQAVYVTYIVRYFSLKLLVAQFTFIRCFFVYILVNAQVIFRNEHQTTYVTTRSVSWQNLNVHKTSKTSVMDRISTVLHVLKLKKSYFHFPTSSVHHSILNAFPSHCG